MGGVTIEVTESMVEIPHGGWTWRVIDPSAFPDAAGWESSERQARAVAREVARAVVRTLFIESGIVVPSLESMVRVRAMFGLPAVEVPDDGV